MSDFLIAPAASVELEPGRPNAMRKDDAHQEDIFG
jgi:hypothetical protein